MPNASRSIRVLLLALPLAACSGLMSGSRGVSASALVAAAPPQLDSADAQAVARSAQSSFERVRSSRLPWTNRVPAAPRCDEIVGRYCLWFEDTPAERDPPPEDPDVARARDGLIVWLDSAGAAHPHDPWIIGQRIRYLIEADRHDAAARAVRECAAEPWWCTALGAFVRHSAGDFGGAEIMFDEALHAMPDTTHAAWTDLSILLDSRDRDRYERLGVAERREFERTFWRLANPISSRPGNARRTEHFARHVLVRLLEDSRSPNRDRWGSDAREILLRYGVGIAWERVRESSLAPGGETSIVTHYARGGRNFLPAVADVDDPSRLDADLLSRTSRTPRTEYAPGFAEAFYALAHQVALFRRGDSLLVAAAYEFPADSLAETTRVDAALVVSALAGDELGVVRREHRGRRGILIASAPSGVVVASVEALAPDERKAGRARIALRVPWSDADRISLSDLLLIRVADEPAQSLHEALSLARSSWTVRRGERVGLYWELYAPDSVPRRATITLSLTREGRGWGRRLAERLGLRDGSGGVRLDWEDHTEAPIVSRGVALDLSRVEPGTYTLEVRVGGEGGSSARRRLVISR